MTHIILLTTSDYRGGRGDDLARLVTSVQHSVCNIAPGMPLHIHHYLLLQRCNAQDPLPDFPADTVVLRCEQMISLSAARNWMLHRVHQDGVLERATLVAFPDDDAWYPAGTLAAMATLFVRDTALGVVICKYASNPGSIAQVPGGLAAARRPSMREFVTNASSNTLFVRAARVQQIRYFDERLGVGAPLNGGEDLDFALRALMAGRHALWLDAPLVGHRDKNHAMRARYFTGSLYAIVRSADDPRLAWQAVRKLLVGVVLVLHGDLAMSAFFKGMCQGLQAMMQPEPEVSRP